MPRQQNVATAPNPIMFPQVPLSHLTLYQTYFHLRSIWLIKMTAKLNDDIIRCQYTLYQI